MKKKKKALKFIATIFLALFFSCIMGSFVYYKAITNGVSLDTEKLEQSQNSNSLKVYDINNQEIKPDSESYIKISKLSKATTDAFIAAEDKRFYSHNGIDYIRICGALISNLKSKSFSEGASTISQQLIKNTQLTSEKTINRKLKEISLASKLEKKYNKNEILEMYLNNIYFGNGAYGIENASTHYFNKSAKDLSIAESALLAGTINAPGIYDIESNFKKANTRKNLILDLMLSQKKINQEQYLSAKEEQINLNITKLSNNNFLYGQIISEACKLLNLNQNQIKNINFKIFSYIDTKLNSEISKQNNSYKIETNPNLVSLVIDNKTHGIVSLTGNKNIIQKKWQPGSTIKPLLVYAPAIEKNIISPATKILDEKINISGYTPVNADKKYHGFVSARNALAKSYNIPAVKILNELGVETAKEFANKMNISFDDSDNNLALALGGFTNGLTPKTICDAYSTFAREGKFQPSTYISKITKSEKIVYENKLSEKQVMKDSTAFLITDILKDTTKTGTAKRLKNINFDLASKTGTVGKDSSTKNVCAYNVSYTTDHTILTLVCGDNMPANINGASYPTIIAGDILNLLYKNSPPKKFNIPSSVSSCKFNKDEYETYNKIISAEDEENYLEDYFQNTNIPPKTNPEKFDLIAVNTISRKPLLCFTLNKNYDYFLIKTENEKEEIIFSSLENSPKFIKFEDKSAQKDKIYEYKLKICRKNSNEEFYSNSIKLKAF